MPDLTPTIRAVAEILWRHHTLARTRVDDFADEAAEILAAVETHRRGGGEGQAGTRVAAVSSPTGTPKHSTADEAGRASLAAAIADAGPAPATLPGARCPSRIAHESGAGLGCLRAPGHQGSHRAGSPPTRWWDDDDRVLPPVIVSYGPTSAPGVSPECQQANPAVHVTCDGCACDCHPVPATAPTGDPTDAL